VKDRPLETMSEKIAVIVVAGQFRVHDRAIKSMRDFLVKPLVRSGFSVFITIHGWTSEAWPREARAVVFKILGPLAEVRVLLDPQLPDEAEELVKSPLAGLHHPDRFRYASQWLSLSKAWSAVMEIVARDAIIIRTRLDAVFMSKRPTLRLIQRIEEQTPQGHFALFSLTEGHSSLPVPLGLTSDQFLCSDTETFSQYVKVFEGAKFPLNPTTFDHQCQDHCDIVGIEQALNSACEGHALLRLRRLVSMPFFLFQKSSLQLFSLKWAELLTAEGYPAFRRLLVQLLKLVKRERIGTLRQ
jgi:hypothetical protein